jgi:PAS domain S-box-containing protein
MLNNPRFFSIPFFLLILALSFSTDGITQNFRNFTSLTDKKNSPVTCALQSPTGELWIGTTSGLIRYDGEKHERFSTENGLIDNSITALYVQNNNTLWIGYKNGKVSTCKNNKFSAFPFNESLSGSPITAFVETDGIWISTYGAGIYFYKQNEKPKQYDSEHGLSDNLVYTLYKDDQNKIWAGTDAGIIYIDPAAKTSPFTTISMKNGLPDNIVRYITGDKHGNIWIAMQDAGVCKYNPSQKKFQAIANNWKYGAVASLCFSCTGSLYIGTKQYGIIEYTEDVPGHTSLKLIDTKNGLLSNEINSTFSDRENNLWIATSKGLSEMYESRISYLPKAGLLSDKILSICMDSKNNYWIGTDKGLIKYSIFADGETIIKNYFLTESSPEKQITCIYEDKAGILWLGTYGQGVYRFDPESEKHIVISQKQGIAYDNISGITADSQNNIWVSTLGGGISKINVDKNKLQIKNYSSLNGLPGDYIYDVFVDSDNKLWIATDGEGIITFDGASFSNISEKNNINGKTIFSITQDNHHKIWFSTGEEGIYKFDPTAAGKGAEPVANFSVKNGLSDNGTLILTSTGNNIVNVHEKGIDLLDVNSDKIRYFSIPDIAPNFNAGFVDKKGNVLIGSNSGVLVFRASQIPADTITPVVHINSLVVQSQPFPMDSTNQFSYRQNSFVFNFSTIWLRSPEKTKVRYRLLGNDNDYTETEGRTASYYNLPSGNYTFSVSASNDEGQWSSPTNYFFTIATPIWQRWWFWLLSVSITIAILYSFIKFRLKALQREKEILEEKVRVRTTEIRKQSEIIEAKNIELEYLSIVARETGNPIIIMDAVGHLEWVNYSFEKLNEMTLSELKKLKGDTIFDISNSPHIRSIVETCVRDKKPIVFESKNTTKKGPATWESSTLTPIYNEKGELQKLIIIDTDVTDRKLAEEIIRRKNKDITDSIEYAKKIQTSILPDLSTIQSSLPDSFIFYLQKDIVSGDFYWYTRKGDTIIIACVDCTGHGVPGAFMSLIGYNLLNMIVNDHQVEEPAKILDELNKGVLNALYKNNPGNNTKDGMDIGICAINMTTKEIQFAGAMRPLYMFNKNGFEEIKGDKIAIGTRETDREYEIKFTNNVIKIENETVFYIFSDGYADQFGGAKGKKMMTKQFKEILSTIYTKPFKEQQLLIAEHYKQWKGNYEQVDDVLVMGFKL